MLILNINNSTCQITGLTSSQHSALKKQLSYTLDPQQAYFSGNFRSNTRSLLDNKGNFPTGLLYIVTAFLKVMGLAVHYIDNRRVPQPRKRAFNLQLGVTPYLDQNNAVKAAIRANRGIISWPTGTGKSVIIALLINGLNVPTLIVVPSLGLKEQLTATLKEWFPGESVGGFGCTIAVENIDSAKLNQKSKYDCVIIDEFHHSAAKTYRKLNKNVWNTVFYKFGLTATAFRNDENERLLLESVLSRVVHRLSYEEAVVKGYIVPVEAYYVDVPLKAVDGYTWNEVYSELVVNNKPRNEIIAYLLNALYADKKKTLCLVKEIEHGNNLTELFPYAPFVNGKDSLSNEWVNKFNTGSKVITIIGTEGVMGEGRDTKPAEYILITGLGKSKGAFMQKVGRGTRRYGDKESCKVILFRDKSHKFTLSHFNKQVKHLQEEYGIKPMRLDIKF